jgi:hypothetical protein
MRNKPTIIVLVNQSDGSLMPFVVLSESRPYKNNLDLLRFCFCFTDNFLIATTMKIIAVISLLTLVSVAEAQLAIDELPDFVPPDLNDYNLTQSETNLTWGYNPWMPKYVGGNPNKTTFVMMTGEIIL